jgi:hypothetical protein
VSFCHGTAHSEAQDEILHSDITTIRISTAAAQEWETGNANRQQSRIQARAQRGSKQRRKWQAICHCDLRAGHIHKCVVERSRRDRHNRGVQHKDPGEPANLLSDAEAPQPTNRETKKIKISKTRTVATEDRKDPVTSSRYARKDRRVGNGKNMTRNNERGLTFRDESAKSSYAMTGPALVIFRTGTLQVVEGNVGSAVSQLGQAAAPRP